ncbi:MAG TPA: J domain-containing protein, partial [Afifellaceae bacterium]|nr:J domain-containing protein [Afifellaceae bacterium]
GDPDKRARYDRGEIDASGAERPPQGFYREHADAGDRHTYYSSAGFEDFDDVSDIFADLFRRREAEARTMRIRGPDMQYRMEVEFLEAANGVKKRVVMPDGNSLDISIPAGVRDGQVLRLKGKGGPGISGGPAGDALVEIAVRPHPLLERQGDDIVVELPITIDEAVLGAKVEVPTISGRVRVNVPKGASSGQTLRLKGKGVKAGPGRAAGDQLVQLKIVLPRDVDPELSEFMTTWRERHPYDPRAEVRRAA